MGNACTCCHSDLESVLKSSPEAAIVYQQLQEILQSRDYLKRNVHPLNHWVVKCESAIEGGRLAEAQDAYNRIDTAVKLDDKRLKSTFDKFDHDRSGQLEVAEFKVFATYVGFGPEAVDMVLADSDKNSDGKITITEFGEFVGRVGGVMALLEKRRNRLASAGDKEVQKIQVGSRVRARYTGSDGQQSKTPWDARVLSLNEEAKKAKLEFGIGKLKMVQEVPLDWIEEDLDLVEALRSIGILDDAQYYWTILLPPSEQLVVKTLTKCQTAALFEVRRQATQNSSEAMRQLLERCERIGISQEQLWATLTWIRDLAPVIVHVNLDTVGPFLEKDTHYRNQFETKTSCGLLSTGTRSQWERDLFGGCYDDAAAFERPKYGVLDVMNDNRGVICARQYGDSYMVLKNARLRCTFAPEDSGGICGSRLAVLDQYAHVLQEYSDDELREVSRVANAPEGSEERIGDSEKLVYYNYKEAQIHGEVDLKKHVKRLVAHPKHKVDGFSEERIRKLCEEKGWDFTWMEDERTRRIHEERELKDGNVLEMSWANEHVKES